MGSISDRMVLIIINLEMRWKWPAGFRWGKIQISTFCMCKGEWRITCFSMLHAQSVSLSHNYYPAIYLDGGDAG